MKFQNVLLLLSSSSLALTAAQECHKTTIHVGGTAAAQPLVTTWISAYNAVCSKTVFAVAKCGGSCESHNVCDQGIDDDQTLDVSDMSRDWRASEATTENGIIYDCVGSDRKAVQVQVANDALAFAVRTHGVAGECLSILGGLTLDQIRWIYSSYNRTQLLETGWDPTSVQNDDLNDKTHLWSELHPECQKVEILISGGTVDSRAYGELKEELFMTDENIPFGGRRAGNQTISYVNSTDGAKLVQYLQKKSSAITFLLYSYAVGVEDGLMIVPIKNSAGEMVRPDAYSITSGDYQPFSSPLYINVLNDERVLTAMRPFFQYAFSEAGSLLVRPQGFIPLSEWQKFVMLTALNAGGISLKDVECGTQPGSFAIGGSQFVFPIAQMWAEIYMAKCPNVKIFYEGGTSTQGADRVCAASGNFSRVDIGTMSRDFTISEATIHEAGYEFGCVGSDRSVIQVETAIDGLSIAVKKGGIAETCINKLGGLTTDQLRWIFSNFNEVYLRDHGWPDDAVPNNDGDSDTKHWSELLDDPACPATQIKIAGPDPLSYSYDFFQAAIFPAYASGESIATARTNNGYVSHQKESALAGYLINNDDAIGFFPFAYTLSSVIVAIPIANDAGKFVSPSVTTVEDGSYNPLSRKMYFNLADNRPSLALTRPFMNMALSPLGQAMVKWAGFAPLPEADRVAMAARVTRSASDGSTSSGGLSAGAIVGILIAVVVVVVGLAFVLMRKNNAKAQGKDMQMNSPYPECGVVAPTTDSAEELT